MEQDNRLLSCPLTSPCTTEVCAPPPHMWCAQNINQRTQQQKIAEIVISVYGSSTHVAYLVKTQLLCFIASTKSDESGLRKAGCVLTRSSRPQDIMVGSHGSKSVRQLLSWHPGSGEMGAALSSFLLFIHPRTPNHGMMLPCSTFRVDVPTQN